MWISSFHRCNKMYRMFLFKLISLWFKSFAMYSYNTPHLISAWDSTTEERDIDQLLIEYWFIIVEINIIFFCATQVVGNENGLSLYLAFQLVSAFKLSHRRVNLKVITHEGNNHWKLYEKIDLPSSLFLWFTVTFCLIFCYMLIWLISYMNLQNISLHHHMSQKEILSKNLLNLFITSFQVIFTSLFHKS